MAPVNSTPSAPPRIVTEPVPEPSGSATAKSAAKGLTQNSSASRPATQAKQPKQTKPTPQPKATLQLPQKKVHRRSSKPLLNWFQRKLGGTVKPSPKRGESPTSQQSAAKGRGTSIPLRATNRVVSSPLPSPVVNGGRQQAKLDALADARRKTVSLNGDDDLSGSDEEDRSVDGSSMARESTWSPASAMYADDDASVRPLPPSAPPSPSPSRSSTSYTSDPRTFRSIAASTKPTTVLSIDLHGNGMAHIAQAPVTPTSGLNRFAPHVRTSSTTTNPNLLGSGASITFSALPPSPPSSRPPSGHQDSARDSPLATPQSSSINSVQAPLHTTHHPRNNPRPSSPPLDNASLLTLASSAFAFSAPGLRPGSSAPPSALGRSDSVSHFGGSVLDADAESASEYVLDDDRLDERDADASVRALRPRSSRRGSWESEASRWSARVQTGAGTSFSRSLWTSNSVRTGAFSADNVELYEYSEGTTEPENKAAADEKSLSEKNDEEPTTPSMPILTIDAPDPSHDVLSPSVASDSEPTPKNNLQEIPSQLTSADTVVPNDFLTSNEITSSVSSPHVEESAEEVAGFKEQVDSATGPNVEEGTPKQEREVLDVPVVPAPKAAD